MPLVFILGRMIITLVGFTFLYIVAAAHFATTVSAAAVFSGVIFMFVPFLIMFREGLEAALIVSLIASYLKRTQRSQWLGAVWIGVIALRRCVWRSVSSSMKPPASSRSSRSCSRDRGGGGGGDPHLYGVLDA